MKTNLFKSGWRIIFLIAFVFGCVGFPSSSAKAEEGDFVPGTLKIWNEGGLWWAENDFYRIEITNASSFVVKAGLEEREWHKSYPDNAMGKFWIGAAAYDAQNNAAFEFWYLFGTKPAIDSISMDKIDKNLAVATIISHGYFDNHNFLVENKLTFKAQHPEIIVTSRLLKPLNDERKITAFIYKFFLT
ncbi:MAG: hypothetical protein EHM81_03490, partial [Chloroflexi bacterium]